MTKLELLESVGRKLQATSCLNDLRQQLRRREKILIYVEYNNNFEKILLLQTAGQLKEIMKRTSRFHNWSFWGVEEIYVVITDQL